MLTGWLVAVGGGETAVSAVATVVGVGGVVRVGGGAGVGGETAVSVAGHKLIKPKNNSSNNSGMRM